MGAKVRHRDTVKSDPGRGDQDVARRDPDQGAGPAAEPGAPCSRTIGMGCRVVETGCPARVRPARLLGPPPASGINAAGADHIEVRLSSSLKTRRPAAPFSTPPAVHLVLAGTCRCGMFSCPSRPFGASVSRLVGGVFPLWFCCCRGVVWGDLKLRWARLSLCPTCSLGLGDVVRLRRRPLYPPLPISPAWLSQWLRHNKRGLWYSCRKSSLGLLFTLAVAQLWWEHRWTASPR